MALSKKILIGRLSKAAGCKVQTIRYYETGGMLPPPERSSGNQRLYSPAHLHRLQFIRHCRDLGFSLERIRRLLELGDDLDRPCAEVDEIARHHLREVEEKIAKLQNLKREFERILASCQGGLPVADCRIIQALSDHGQCLDDNHHQQSCAVVEE